MLGTQIVRASRDNLNISYCIVNRERETKTASSPPLHLSLAEGTKMEDGRRGGDGSGFM